MRNGRRVGYFLSPSGQARWRSRDSLFQVISWHLIMLKRLATLYLIVHACMGANFAVSQEVASSRSDYAKSLLQCQLVNNHAIRNYDVILKSSYFSDVPDNFVNRKETRRQTQDLENGRYLIATKNELENGAVSQASVGYLIAMFGDSVPTVVSDGYRHANSSTPLLSEAKAYCHWYHFGPLGFADFQSPLDAEKMDPDRFFVRMGGLFSSHRGITVERSDQGNDVVVSRIDGDATVRQTISKFVFDTTRNVITARTSALRYPLSSGRKHRDVIRERIEWTEIKGINLPREIHTEEIQGYVDESGKTILFTTYRDVELTWLSVNVSMDFDRTSFTKATGSASQIDVRLAIPSPASSVESSAK
jgi:hypothetical protein